MKHKLIHKPLGRKGKGFALVGVMIALGIVSIITLQGIVEYNAWQQKRTARNVGDHIKEVGIAANNYVTTHYKEIGDLISINPSRDATASGDLSTRGWRQCHTTGTTSLGAVGDCEISVQTLVTEGFLPIQFSDKNPVGQEYRIKLNVKPLGGDVNMPIVNGLIVTNKPWMKDRKIPNYALIGEAVQQAGVDAGLVPIHGTNGMRGYKGSWELSSADFSNIDQRGLMGYRFGFHSGALTAFLRRDGSLPMTGNLDMGKNPIINITQLQGYVPDGGSRDPDTGAMGSGDKVLDIPDSNVNVDKWLCVGNGNHSPKTGKYSQMCFGGKTNTHFDIKVDKDGERVQPVYIHARGGNDNGDVILNVGGSATIGDNLRVGAPYDNSSKIFAHTGSPEEDRALINDFAHKGGSDSPKGVINSTYNVTGGTTIVREGQNPDANDVNRWKPGTGTAVELTNNGAVIADDIFIRGIDGEKGLALTQAIPAYSSRGAFVVRDEDIIQKPNCTWKHSGTKLGDGSDGLVVKGTPRIIMSVGNVHTSGDDVDQSGNAIDVRYQIKDKNGQQLLVTGPDNLNVDARTLLDQRMKKHRLLLKAVSINDNYWRVLIKTRSFDGSGEVSAGQAVAHVYCQNYSTIQ